MRLRYASGAFSVTNSGAMVCPGGANVSANVGDMFFVVHQGNGVWLIVPYTRANTVAGLTMPTGTLFFMYGSTAVAGAVIANGLTIGNAGSGASSTGAAYLTLFTQIVTES